MTRKTATVTSIEPVVAATPAIEAPAPIAQLEDALATADAILASATPASNPWDFAIPQPKVANPWDFAVSAMQEAADNAEIEEQIALSNSKVKPLYKKRYRNRALALGLRHKWQKRTNNDWMATQLAGEVLDKHSKIHVPSFAAILIANGVEEPNVLSEDGEFLPENSRWPSQSKGWEGRYRMSGGLALRTVVAEAGKMILADGEELEAPAEWIAKILR